MLPIRDDSEAIFRRETPLFSDPVGRWHRLGPVKQRIAMVDDDDALSVHGAREMEEVASHELRTPVAAIWGFTETLLAAASRSEFANSSQPLDGTLTIPS
jgi:signal transduction histidine kinase